MAGFYSLSRRHARRAGRLGAIASASSSGPGHLTTATDSTATFDPDARPAHHRHEARLGQGLGQYHQLAVQRYGMKVGTQAETPAATAVNR
jgi:hypothetical protein